MRSIAISIFLTILAMIASAQSDSLLIPSIQEVYRQNDWLEGGNPVGLSFNRFQSFSIAEAGFRSIDGNLGNLSVPASKYTYKVYSESFQMLGKASIYGKLGYRNDQKKEISWQGMSGEYWQGVNLCDSVSGNQRSEQYQLVGAFAWPLSRHWLIGTRFDYEVELTAKDTDPRNKNQWMEWKLSPGIGYQHGHSRLGASVFYTSRKEAVDYQNTGTHITYPFLVAYPLAFFKTLPLGQNVSWNYSAYETGGSLQAEVIGGSFSLFQEVMGSVSGQEVISNRIENKKENETRGWRLDYLGKLQKVSAHNRHEWAWQVIMDRSRNHEPLQQQDDTHVWNSYGEVFRSAHYTSDYKLSYRYTHLRDIWNPLYSFLAGIDIHQEKRNLYFYPIEYTQPFHRLRFHTTLNRNIFLRHGQLNCAFGGEYINGGGHLMEEKRLSPNPSVPEIALWQNQERLRQEFYYQIAPRWNIHVSITYTHIGSFRWFASLQGKYEEGYKKLTDKNIKHFSTQIGLLF